MTTAPLFRRSAADLAAAIRAREVSAEEVVRAHLDRIDAVNSALNALVVVLREDALVAARAADRALASGSPVGPLHGVPFTVKENLDLAGSATTQGLRALENARPPQDAPITAQLRRAGAIPIGRTNLPDLGMRWHTDNELRGATRNPWDAARTPGGSSGGDAAALATGMTPLALGNDYGGSLRWPSQCCGTTALKPTPGRLARFGVAPQEAAITLQLYAVDGPMARHVRDLRLAFASMSGPDARDPWWTPAPLEGDARPTRVAVVRDPDGLGVDRDVAAGVARAADALANAGWAVEEAAPPSCERGMRIWAETICPELRVDTAPVMKSLGGRDALRFFEDFLAVMPDAGLAGYVRALADRNGYAREWAQFQERYPVVLGPVRTAPPFAVGSDLGGPDAVQAILHSMRLVVSVNLLGLPAVALPTGVERGLPQGVQVIAPRFREDLCLTAAQAIEQRLGVQTPIDPR
jgi:amidase